jgi:hydroxymethylbilane synthase
VHSLKDLETSLPPGIVLACTLPRADPRDALILQPRHLVEEKRLPYPMLPVGARIGTASARRQAQLLHARPDLRIGLIHGNVQTRIDSDAGSHVMAAIVRRELSGWI